MIERHETVNVSTVEEQNLLTIEGNSHLFKDALFFDLEHYIYKKPICIGVFGCCYFDMKENKLEVTQYMIENKNDIKSILKLARDYFKLMYEKYNKRYIITFSGNNDFTVINYLFEKYKIDFDINEHFFHLDLQKQYEKEKREPIGLKALERKFSIFRDSELISGSNLAKTFSKIIKDSDYISRMPEDKKEKILLYNQQDVVSLFHIYVNWNSVVNSNILDETTE
ncbi:ribonuclease H-like domain-containing protein [Clostridium magnum]|uniref:YprB ribonuclease H-like domain-containing protein n=1 Tax=Clostridium magnum DSM 2767 TaxID=1121326 RepID=A0A162SF93_9CLOT|nr:hypothetical protein CLMAG_29250 [Clostridium magnum DSM 2767]SHI17702.1 RNase_H superfamily protein [Clostridium magnum DSM 2767]